MPGAGDYSIETDMMVKYSTDFFRQIEGMLGSDSWELKPIV
jgi:hypothetical protein